MSEQNMSHCRVGVLLGGLTRGNHVTVLEFHGLGTCCTELSTHNHLIVKQLCLEKKKVSEKNN